MDDASASLNTRLLPSCRLGGAWQMAIDHWLLAQEGPALRLYHWQRPTLSLGLHQRRIPDHWKTLAAAGRVELVRRPSGGQAVLHGGDLTYALVWPQPPGDRQQAYRQACLWLQRAFEQLGQPLAFGSAPASLAGSNCFASSTAADLVHADGTKRIGSAQFWRAGRLLQHGSIQLAVDRQLWRDLFAAPAPALAPLPARGAELERLLLDAAARFLPLPPVREGPLRAAELAEIAAGLDRYRLGVTESSPEATMARTTWGRARPRG
ncbi:MAG: lipoate--protein ligase family protein [Cyanobium sp. M30B3]|nr:MAG: lipoate--protein ligase family protein [Cyanobium sp. M30B3]